MKITKNYTFSQIKVCDEGSDLSGGRYTPKHTTKENIDLIYGGLCRGYASTWDVDLIGDVITPGAFANSIQTRFVEELQRGLAPSIKVLSNHASLAGILTYIKETPEGLYVEFFCLNSSVGRDLYVEIASGAVCQMSIGFVPLKTRKGNVDVDGVTRYIDDVDLIEVSGVMWPCNEATVLASKKVEESLKIVTIKELCDQLMSLTKSVEDYTLIRDTFVKVCDQMLSLPKNNVEATSNKETTAEVVLEKNLEVEEDSTKLQYNLRVQEMLSELANILK